MQSVLFGATTDSARALAEPLKAGGYAPEVRIVEHGAVSDEDLAATRGMTIVFIDLAIGTPATTELCVRISASTDPVPPLIAIVGHLAESDADHLIAAGASMYFPGDPERLAFRLRFLRRAVAGRAELAKTVTKLRASEERNRQLEIEYRAVLERMPSPVFVHRDGRILWTNQPGAELLGVRTGAEAIGLSPTDLVPETSRPMIEKRLRERAVGKHDEPFEQTIVRRDGREAHLWVVGMPTMFDGKPAGIAFVRDLTEQRQLETQLMASDRLAALGRLAASVGHEINNPLTYVLGNLQLATRALRDGPPGRDLPEMLEAAITGAEQVRRIVDDLRVFSQRQAEVLAPVDLRAVVESCTRMTSGELRHRAKLVQAIDDVPPVLANEPRLAQVITNLLLNAAQALPEGAADKNCVTLAARLDGDHVELRIEDTGEGIAPEHLPHVFEPFFTTKTERGGTGLGLAICKMLVAAQNGELAIASELGRGTRVTLRLQVATGRRTVSAAEPGPRPVTPRRVLLIDDDPQVAAVLGKSFEPHDVTLATSGREALGRLDAGQQFDVIVCDLMMPEIGGVDVHERIAARYPGLEQRIVFMTGGAFTPLATRFIASVPNVCLQKPFDLDRMMEEIERAANR